MTAAALAHEQSRHGFISAGLERQRRRPGLVLTERSFGQVRLIAARGPSVQISTGADSYCSEMLEIVFVEEGLVAHSAYRSGVPSPARMLVVPPGVFGSLWLHGNWQIRVVSLLVAAMETFVETLPEHVEVFPSTVMLEDSMRAFVGAAYSSGFSSSPTAIEI